MTNVPEEFSSEREEAAFWDENDLAALSPGELEEVEVHRPPRPLSTTFAVRLDQASVGQIRAIAKARGVGPTQLARSWLLERLRLEAQAGELANPDADEEELRIRRAVMDQVAQGVPEIAAAALVALGIGAAGVYAGSKASQAKKRRDARVASAARKKRETAGVTTERKGAKGGNA